MATTTPLLNVQLSGGWGTQYLMSPKDYAALVEIICRSIVVERESYRDVDDYKSVFVNVTNFRCESSTERLPVISRDAFDALKQEAMARVEAKKAEEAAATTEVQA